MTSLPEPLDLGGYKPGNENVTTYRITPMQAYRMNDRGYIDLPFCRCPPEAEHDRACMGPSYRVLNWADTGLLHVWSRPPGDYYQTLYQPADVFVRAWQEEDPRMYVIEISDPHAEYELRELPPAWEYR